MGPINQDVMFLMIPPKDEFADLHIFYDPNLWGTCDAPICFYVVPFLHFSNIYVIRFRVFN
jgi:hypothetical protein